MAKRAYTDTIRKSKAVSINSPRDLEVGEICIPGITEQSWQRSSDENAFWNLRLRRRFLRSLSLFKRNSPASAAANRPRSWGRLFATNLSPNLQLVVGLAHSVRKAINPFKCAIVDMDSSHMGLLRPFYTLLPRPKCLSSTVCNAKTKLARHLKDEMVLHA